MRRELITLGVAASILVSLLAFTQPTSAVLTTVSGSDDFTKPEKIEFDTTVEIREDERVPIESFTLIITTDAGESVTITFARDGTVQSIEPAKGTVGTGDIRIQQLRESLEITPVESNADFGYGYGYGTNERTGESRSFGYGYGYGYGGAQPSFSYEITMNSTAFDRGDYTVQLTVNTDDGDTAFASNEKSFEVLTRGDERRAGQGPPDDLPEQAADHVDEVHDTIDAFIDGTLDGPLGQALQDLDGPNDSRSEGAEDAGSDDSGNERGGSSNDRAGRA